jgi:uncharacterized membrane protein YfcA
VTPTLVFLTSLVLVAPTLRLYLAGGVDATTAVLRWLVALTGAALGARLLSVVSRTGTRKDHPVD